MVRIEHFQSAMWDQAAGALGINDYGAGEFAAKVVGIEGNGQRLQVHEPSHGAAQVVLVDEVILILEVDQPIRVIQPAVRPNVVRLRAVRSFIEVTRHGHGFRTHGFIKVLESSTLLLSASEEVIRNVRV